MRRRKVNEAPRDFRLGNPMRGKKVVTILPHDFRSKGPMKVRYTGNYGDNAMSDPAKLNEDARLEHLHNMLGEAGVSDDEIKSGVSLTDKGKAKVARRIGCSEDEVGDLLAALTQHLRDKLAEARYAHEADYIGNVTIRDKETSQEWFLRASEAAQIMNRIKAGEDENDVLTDYVENNLLEADMDDLTDRSGRAMKMSDEDPDREKAHWDAHEKTGFYGSQGAGVLVLARDTGRILLALRSSFVEEPLTWGNFGGAIDAGESPREAAIGEFYEETGYRGEVSDVKPLFVFKKGTFRYSNFLVIVPHEFEPDLNWEADDYRWCEWGEWPRPLHFGVKAVFNDGTSVETIKKSMRKILDENEEEDFMDEIRNPVGTFNFPWKAMGQRGFATARYDTRKQEIEILSVRDADGDILKPSRSLMAKIEEQAEEFIGEA